MSKCNSTTVFVYLRHIEVQVSCNCYRLCCKCLVCLDKINVIDCKTCLSKNFLCRSNRTNTHDLRTNTTKCSCYECSHWLNSKLFCLLFCHNNNCCCTIVDTGCITGCNNTALFTGAAFQLRKAFCCCARTWTLILREDDRLFCLAVNTCLYRYDLIIKLACCNSCLALLLAVCCKLIKFFTGKTPLISNILCCDHHMIMIECIC